MTAKIGPRELAQRAMREQRFAGKTKEPATGKAEAETVIANAADAAAEETVMSKKKAKKPARKKAAARKKAPVRKAASKKVAKNGKPSSGGVREGSKRETVVGLLKRSGGCTRADVLAATGWPSVSLPSIAKASGLTLRKEKSEGQQTRYWGA